MLSIADPARWSSLVERAVAMAHDTEADLLVNGDIALAERLGIGVHLRAAQLPTLSARPAVAGSVIASCHTLDELMHAQTLDCDAAVLGPVLPTVSHPGQPGIGWNAFAGLRERVALPIYAIGGLSVGDVEVARAHGAQGIAAIRGLWPG
jgi:8-oxo-dGTP diphosphatase